MRKEAKNAYNRFNALGASFAEIERFPCNIENKSYARGNLADDTNINSSDHDNMSTVSSIEGSLISVPIAKHSTTKSNHSKDKRKIEVSSKEIRSTTSRLDIDSERVLKASEATQSKSSGIVRRAKRKLDDEATGDNGKDQNGNGARKAAATKGIQITPNGSYRVQLNKAKNSTEKYTKNLYNPVEALWLFEIFVLVCDKPELLSGLLKSGNYQYLLENNYIRDCHEYKHKLGEYILLLLQKKTLTYEQAEKAMAIFSNLIIDDKCYNDQVVDPVDLQNLLSLKG
jgi:hypothetical protein